MQRNRRTGPKNRENEEATSDFVVCFQCLRSSKSLQQSKAWEIKGIKGEELGNKGAPSTGMVISREGKKFPSLLKKNKIKN